MLDRIESSQISERGGRPFEFDKLEIDKSIAGATQMSARSGVTVKSLSSTQLFKSQVPQIEGQEFDGSQLYRPQ
jgi:hypothetical protein